MAGSRPLAAAIGAVGAPLLHLLDVSQFVPLAGSRWTDALVTETRRHLAGCLAAIEARIRQELAATGLAAVPGNERYAWDALQRHPQLIGAGVIAHMRARGAVGMLGREPGVAGGGATAPEGEDLGWLHSDADPAVVRLAGSLMVAESRWIALGGEDMEMRPDLPAEHFADLAWTAAALLGTDLTRSGTMAPEAVMAVVADATLRVVAAHDEGETPIAQAAMLARRLRDRDDAPRLLGLALAHRRILLFAALAGERVGIATEAALHALVHLSPRHLAGLCHALGGSAADYKHLLILLRPVRSGLEDAVIIALAADYDRLTAAEADAVVSALRGPADLRAKLALIDPADRG